MSPVHFLLGCGLIILFSALLLISAISDLERAKHQAMQDQQDQQDQEDQPT